MGGGGVAAGEELLGGDVLEADVHVALVRQQRQRTLHVLRANVPVTM